MGLWGKIKNGANKAKKKAEEAKRKADEFARRKAREAKEKAERKARDAARAAERKAREARQKAEQATRAAQRAFEDALERTTDPMERLVLKAERAIKEGMSEMDVRKMLQDELGKMRDGLKREVLDELRREVVDPVEGLVTEKLPGILEDFAQKMAAGVAKEGLKKTRKIVSVSYDKMSWLSKNKPELVGEINALGGKVEIGPMTLQYSGFYDRMEGVLGVLDRYIDAPPKLRRRDILAMIQALGPTSVDTGVSVQVVAVVVGSKELGMGGGLNDIGLALFLEIADAIMEAAGVPE